MTRTEIHEAGLDAILAAAAGMTPGEDGHITDEDIERLWEIADETEAMAEEEGD